MASAQGFPNPSGSRPELTDPGNVSQSIQGSRPAPREGEDAHELQHTLPADFSLANTKADVKGGDHLEPDTSEPGGVLQAGDLKADHKRSDVASHDIDIPGNDPHMPPQAAGEKKIPGSQY